MEWDANSVVENRSVFRNSIWDHNTEGGRVRSGGIESVQKVVVIDGGAGNEQTTSAH
jgi:hypothetical protein